MKAEKLIFPHWH